MWAKSSWCLGQRRRTRAGAVDPRGPGREKLGSHVLLATRPLHFILLSELLCPLSFPKVPIVMTSPPSLFFLFSQGCPLPPSCPLRRLGSDHLDVWALPRGQGGSEGGQLLPAPTLSLGLLCCFCAKASQSLPILFCELELLSLPHLPSCSCPTTSPKN